MVRASRRAWLVSSPPCRPSRHAASCPLRRSRSRPCRSSAAAPVRARLRLASAARADSDSSSVSRSVAPWEPIAPLVAPGGGCGRVPVEVFSSCSRRCRGEEGCRGSTVEGSAGVCVGGGAGRVALGPVGSGWRSVAPPVGVRRSRPRGDAAAGAAHPPACVESEREAEGRQRWRAVRRMASAPLPPRVSVRGAVRGFLPPPPPSPRGCPLRRRPAGRRGVRAPTRGSPGTSGGRGGGGEVASLDLPGNGVVLGRGRGGPLERAVPPRPVSPAPAPGTLRGGSAGSCSRARAGALVPPPLARSLVLFPRPRALPSPLTATSDQTWRPAEFKHISQRRKRN